MIKKITPKMPIDDVLDEIGFTRAALHAVPQARHLLAMTDDWKKEPLAVQVAMRQNRDERMVIEAERVMAGNELKALVIKVGDGLLPLVNKDRTSTLWTQYFRKPPSELNREALPERVQILEGWLDTDHPIINDNRDALRLWTEASKLALLNEEKMRHKTAAVDQARELMARNLTEKRDTLWGLLNQLGRDLKRPRNWANGFFRKR